MSDKDIMGFSQAILANFSPAKSPYYAVVFSGVFSLILLSYFAGDRIGWLFGFPAIGAVLIFATVMALRSRPEYNVEEYNEQLRFARAISLSVGMLSLAFCVSDVKPGMFFAEKGIDVILEDQYLWYFWLSYICSLGQIAVFAVYFLVYKDSDVEPRKVNFVQLSLVTSAFVVGCTYCSIHISHIVNETNIRVKGFFSLLLDITSTRPIVWAMLLLFILWIVCIGYWLSYLIGPIKPRDVVEHSEN